MLKDRVDEARDFIRLECVDGLTGFPDDVGASAAPVCYASVSGGSFVTMRCRQSTMTFDASSTTILQYFNEK